MAAAASTCAPAMVARPTSSAPLSEPRPIRAGTIRSCSWSMAAFSAWPVVCCTASARCCPAWVPMWSDSPVPWKASCGTAVFGMVLVTVSGTVCWMVSATGGGGKYTSGITSPMLAIACPELI
ncbi:hypothetical protein SANT12839_010160 [Streptomyces antimycoticus]|uniref:Uncharacterized protein n=1 Tax=Streptomyces antimycoticus TaxID=68175 RepID=A0A4D4JW64_9ACTN|nr:hypothetical protein SANT12839_010160 [Streptomyces antimycoticus]